MVLSFGLRGFCNDLQKCNVIVREIMERIERAGYWNIGSLRLRSVTSPTSCYRNTVASREGVRESDI